MILSDLLLLLKEAGFQVTVDEPDKYFSVIVGVR